MRKNATISKEQNSNQHKSVETDCFNEITLFNKKTNEECNFIIDSSNQKHIEHLKVIKGRICGINHSQNKQIVKNKIGRPKDFFTKKEREALNFSEVNNSDITPPINIVPAEACSSSLLLMLSKYGVFNESPEDYKARMEVKIKEAKENGSYDPDDFLPPEQRRDFYYIEKNLEWYMLSIGLDPENPHQVQKVKQFGNTKLSFQSLKVKEGLAKKLVVNWLLDSNIGFYEGPTFMVRREMLEAKHILNFIAFFIATKSIDIGYYGGKKNKHIPLTELLKIYKIFGVVCTPSIIKLYKVYELKILKNKIHQSPSSKQTFNLYHQLYTEYKESLR